MHWIWKNLIICSILAIGVFAFLFYSETGNTPFLWTNWTAMLLAIVMINIGGAAFFQLGLFLNKHISWKKKLGLRFVTETLAGSLIFAICTSIFFYFYIMPQENPENELGFWELYSNGFIKYFILSTVLLFMYAIVSFAVFSYNQYTVGQLESMEMERDQLRLQLDALKAQLSPHFLFNALNTISALIYKSTSITEDYIRKLAKTYEYILTTEHRQLVKLYEEIEMCEAYFYMQKTKYEDCISLSIDIESSKKQSLIPPLSLQILVENALKHNQICEDINLIIEVFHNTNGLLTVRNNVIKKPVLLKIGNDLYEKPQANDSHKIGLNNIRQRYKYYSGKDIEINHSEYFTVALPEISRKNET